MILSLMQFCTGNQSFHTQLEMRQNLQILPDLRQTGAE